MVVFLSLLPAAFGHYSVVEGGVLMRAFITFLFLFLVACKPEVSVKGREYTMMTESGLTITLSFDTHTDRYFGKAINRYFGKYQVSHSKMMFTPPASTMKMGPEEYMADEEKYFDQLSQVKSYRITDSDLILDLSDGSTLYFTEQKNTPFRQEGEQK